MKSGQIQVVTGVTGGFMPAVPSKTVIVQLGESGANITKYVKSQDPGATDGYMETRGSVAVDRVQSMFTESVNVLRTLPTEQPKGGEDIYHQDISIIVDADEFHWQNIPNQGCNIRPSKVKPTDAQIEQFKSIVDKIHALADQI